MDQNLQNQPDEVISQSVYVKKNWPYAGVDEELVEKNFEGKPYGPFHDWLYQLNLNINNNADHETSHLLICLLNYAATHDNKIEDTRDFLGFFWWYNEKIKKLHGIGDTDKRKAAYQSLVYLILEKTNYLSIDLFSSSGEIYSISLLDKNAGISDYMAIKIKLERLYAGFEKDKEMDFLSYLDLREIDKEFFETLSDPEIYSTYIQEFFLYELTTERIQELMEDPKLAVIKIPTKQTVLIPPEYLNQLTRLCFFKLSQVFYNEDDSIRNNKVLSRIIEKVNTKNDKKYSINTALYQMKEMDTLETEHEFWSHFLEGITSCTQEEVEGAGNLQMYAFLLGAVMPEEVSGEEEKTVIKLIKSQKIDEEDIVAFFNHICEDKTTDYTFASFLEMLPGLPFTEKYRGMEKDFIEKSLDVLIRDRHITKLREPNPKNISHFIVSKNIITVFYSYIDKIRDKLTSEYQISHPDNEKEFRLDMEKKVCGNFPIFYQLYVNKDFAGYVSRMLDKMAPEISDKYKPRLFIAAAEKPSFLPLPELLGISLDTLQSQNIVEIQENDIEKSTAEPGDKKESDTITGNSQRISSAGESSSNKPTPEKPLEKTEKSTNQKEAEIRPPEDIIEIILIFIDKIGKGIGGLFGGFKSTFFSAIEKDLEKKKRIRTIAYQKKSGRTGKQSAITAKSDRIDEQRRDEKDIQLSLQAIAKTMIEDFTGSSELSMEEAVNTLSELWNDPKTIKKDEKETMKKDFLSQVNRIIKNNCNNLYAKTITLSQVMERAAEIANFHEIEDILKKMAPRKESKEVIKRYIALCLAAMLLRK